MPIEPGFTSEYVPAGTMQEADADLLAMLDLSEQMVKQSIEIRPDAANMRGSLQTLDEIKHHIERAASLCRWMKGSYLEKHSGE